MVKAFKLLDGTSIPWLAYGNGSGAADKTFPQIGGISLDAGFTHLDTAQGYGGEKQEQETGDLLRKTKADIYLTSKLSRLQGWTTPQPIDQIRSTVEASVKKLGRVPDLFLIHNPFVPGDGSGKAHEINQAWKVLEEMKDEGKLKSIGVSNFRPQDLKAILDECKHKPVVNQVEYHPYVLAHLEPVLNLQKEHGIVTESYGPLTPWLRNKGGRLDEVLTRIAERVRKDAKEGAKVDETSVLLLWTKAQGVVAITTSGTESRIRSLAATDDLPDLKPEEVEEITKIGKQVHFRHYTEHMEDDFPLPNLPSK